MNDKSIRKILIEYLNQLDTGLYKQYDKTRKRQDHFRSA